MLRAVVLEKILYSHRLKSVLQHTVRDLGVTMSLDDRTGDFSIRANEPMIRETADLMRLRVEIMEIEGGTAAIFYPK